MKRRNPWRSGALSPRKVEAMSAAELRQEVRALERLSARLGRMLNRSLRVLIEELLSRSDQLGVRHQVAAPEPPRIPWPCPECAGIFGTVAELDSHKCPGRLGAE
jgi:hypothetical protein